jgi:hypothetical protein
MFDRYVPNAASMASSLLRQGYVFHEAAEVGVPNALCNVFVH